MATRTFSEPRALTHELARFFRQATDGDHTLNSHLKREGVLRAVSRLGALELSGDSIPASVLATRTYLSELKNGRCERTWIRFAAQFGTLVVMPSDESCKVMNKTVSLDGLPWLSSCMCEGDGLLTGTACPRT